MLERNEKQLITFRILDILIATGSGRRKRDSIGIKEELTGGGGGGIQTPGANGRRKRGSVGVMEELTALIRRKREVRYRCNMTMTYGVMFYDIRNKEVKNYYTYVKLLS